MFLHIGDDVIIPMKEIVAILDLNLSKSETTGEFLQIVADEGFVEFPNKEIEDSSEKIKTFIMTTNKIYYSSISTSTLLKRANNVLSNLELRTKPSTEIKRERRKGRS